MAYVMPDARWERPELFEPKKKPTCEVEFDRGHPLASMFGKRMGMNLFKDGEFHSLNNTMKMSFDTRTAGLNPVVGDHIHFASTSEFLTTNDVPSTFSKVSWSMEIRLNNDARYEVFQTIEASTNRIWLWNVESAHPNGGISASLIGGNAFTNTDLTVGKWQQIAASFDGTNLVWFLDGVQIYSSAVTPTNGGYMNLGKGLLDIRYLIMDFDNAWTANQVSALHASPYQFLVPK